MITSRRWDAIRWLVIIATLTAVVGYPAFRLGVEVVTNAGVIGAAIISPPSVAALGNTAGLAIGTTVIALIIGTVGALVVRRTGSRALEIAMISPILVPPFVSALSWVDAYAVGGLIHDISGIHWDGLFGPVGVTASIAVNAAPIVFLIVSAGLSAHREPDLVEAALASGASAATAIRQITLPLIRRAVLGSGAVVMVITANSFGVPAVLGLPAGFHTITTLIHRELAFSAAADAFSRAVGLSVLLVVLAFALAVTVERPSPGGTVRSGVTGAPHRVRPRLRGWEFVLWGYWAAAVLLPLIALILRAIVRAPGLDPVPANLTLAHFRTAWTSLALGAAANSILLALAAATLCVLLGATLLTVRATRIGRILETVPIASFAVPGSALAVAALLAYSPGLRDTIVLVLIVYVGKFWVLAHRPLAGAIDRIPPEMRLAAQASGANRWAEMVSIVGPMLRPAVSGAWILVFVFAVHELTMSVLLFGPGSETLATVILNLRQLGDPSATAALALTMTLAVAAIAAPLAFGSKRRRMAPV